MMTEVFALFYGVGNVGCWEVKVRHRLRSATEEFLPYGCIAQKYQLTHQLLRTGNCLKT